MTHDEAKKTLEQSDAQIIIDDANGTVTIDGELTIQEFEEVLQAVLQLLEHGA